jgi:ABC-type nitrate/sulfonate/bicarbonate transport system ATPase subunit
MHLECRDIAYRYPGADRDVFQDLDFRIQGPGFHALFGPSGVGKTTLARMLIGQLDVGTGRLEGNGLTQRLYSYNLERLPGWSSVGQHLDRVCPPEQAELKTRLLSIFGMRPFLEARFAQLSLGQKNRINLIRYLLQDFHLLIMDESLANVDERTRETILLAVKEVFPERFFLYISHNVVEVATYCREIVVLRASGKQPQAVTVAGQDLRAGNSLERSRLECTMLEIVNAA